jgi:hypothetical protein
MPLTFAALVETLEIVTLPLVIVMLLSVTPFNDVAVLPKSMVVVPITTLLLARNPLGNCVLTLVMARLAKLMLLRVVIVPPNKTELLPMVMAVAKLASSCDRGRELVAVAKVYGTDI